MKSLNNIVIGISGLQHFRLRKPILLFLIALLIATVTVAGEASPPLPKHGGELIPWFWSVAGDQTALAHLAVVAIALLSAFLTVAELWSVKNPNTRPVTASSPITAEGEMNNVPTYGAAALLFQSNFSRTVLSGVAGLALVSTFDGLWQVEGIQQKPYFLALFVVFFLSFLFLSAVARGFTEVGRSRISIVRRYPRQDGKWTYPFRRLWLWLLSLRTAILVFADTAFNVVLGRNQLKTAEFENEIADLHRSIVGAVDQIRRQIDNEVKEALNRLRLRSPEEMARHSFHEGPDVRVSISVLSQDESALYYISREDGSIARGFGKGSLAWLAVYTGRPLWWRSTYEKHKERIVLIDNVRQGSQELKHPELEPKCYLLEDHFESRGDQDYKAFIILPLPWGHRGAAGDHQKAGIHISFKHENDLGLLWGGLTPLVERAGEGDDAKKATADTMLNLNENYEDLIRYRPSNASWASDPHLKDNVLAADLERTVPLLSELLRHFNDTVFEEYIRPLLRPQ